MMTSPFPRDPYGDPRDYAGESRLIVDGHLPLSPTLAHCLARLRDVLTRKEIPYGSVAD